MSTRRKENNDGPISQERYMSSPEYVELRGLSAFIVSQKCAILDNPETRSLIWFLQARSLAQGGFRRLAAELIAMFPERLGTPTMHELGTEAGKIYQPNEVFRILGELGGSHELARMVMSASVGEEEKPLPAMSVGEMQERCKALQPRLVTFLVDLCINPRIQINLSGESNGASTEVGSAMEQFPGLTKHEFKCASVPFFHNVVEALLEYKRRYEQKAKESFQLTDVGRVIWEKLDFALATNGMVLIDGLEGRGKTEAVKAWCNLHQGEARYVSLNGINNKTLAFREVSKTLGVEHGTSRTVQQMQKRNEDVLQQSKLMLVIDEAHYLFNQGLRVYSRPELVDWVVTALCNHAVPVGLITTPQFLDCMASAANQIGWNYRQFNRRKKYVRLPAKNTLADIEAVARKTVPGADNSAIKLIMGYVVFSKRDLSAVGDVVKELKAMTGCKDLLKVTFDQVKEAIDQQLLPSDQALEEELQRRIKKPKRMAAPVSPRDQEEPETVEPFDAGDRIQRPSGGRPSTPMGSNSRLQHLSEGLVETGV